MLSRTEIKRQWPLKVFRLVIAKRSTSWRSTTCVNGTNPFISRSTIRGSVAVSTTSSISTNSSVGINALEANQNSVYTQSFSGIVSAISESRIILAIESVAGTSLASWSSSSSSGSSSSRLVLSREFTRSQRKLAWAFFKSITASAFRSRGAWNEWWLRRSLTVTEGISNALVKSITSFIAEISFLIKVIQSSSTKSSSIRCSSFAGSGARAITFVSSSTSASSSSGTLENVAISVHTFSVTSVIIAIKSSSKVSAIKSSNHSKKSSKYDKLVHLDSKELQRVIVVFGTQSIDTKIPFTHNPSVVSWVQ